MRRHGAGENGILTQLAIAKMGEEIGTSGFTRDDFVQFADRLAEETEFVRRLFTSDGFSRREHTLGFELECWILDHNYFPASINQQLLETLAHPLVVPELSRFNVELNCEPLPLSGDVFGRAEKALSQLWTKCNDVAHTLDANMVLIGTLPTIHDEDLSLANMSPLNRFYALNREVMRQRSGHAVSVDIEGADHLISTHRDVMLEAATTSFQIHLKAPMDLANRYYNASVAISGRNLSHRDLPAEQSRTKLGQRLRPLIGALQPHPGRGARPPERITFAVDVELLTPIGTTSRQLVPSPGVAAKMRRSDHLNVKLGSLRKIEKFAGDGESFCALLCCNAVSSQIEKPDIMRRFAQIGQEIQIVRAPTIKPAQIKPWKQRRGVRHVQTPRRLGPIGNLTGARILPHAYAVYRLSICGHNATDE
jgi:hypothetical protein